MHLQRHAYRPQPRMSKRKKFLIRRQLNSWAQLDARHAFLADIDAGDLSSGHAESIQHLCAYKTSLANMPAKGKKGERGPKGGYKVTRSNLSIAERKAKLAELKKNSRCLRRSARPLGRRP